MILNFLKKQREEKEKRKLLVIMIQSINISQEQKTLYLESLEILDGQWINNLYRDITYFIEKVEAKESEQIHKENFSKIDGMKKQEENEKKKEMNSFEFLLHNL